MDLSILAGAVGDTKLVEVTTTKGAVQKGEVHGKAGLTRTREPGPLGQFQICLVKPLVRFLTLPYLHAQRILQLSRAMHIFHMQSIYIARQALHLVILLNDVVDVDQGPDDQQYQERIDLGDELLDLFDAMQEWGASSNEGESVDYDQRLPKIKQQYDQFFRERFYFHEARNPSDDVLYRKLLAYDQKTIEFRKRKFSHSVSSIGIDAKGTAVQDEGDAGYEETPTEMVGSSLVSPGLNGPTEQDTLMPSISDLSQRAPDIRLATSGGLGEPSERQIAIISNDPSLATLSPVTPMVPQPAHTAAGPSEEDEKPAGTYIASHDGMAQSIIMNWSFVEGESVIESTLDTHSETGDFVPRYRFTKGPNGSTMILKIHNRHSLQIGHIRWQMSSLHSSSIFLRASAFYNGRAIGSGIPLHEFRKRMDGSPDLNGRTFFWIRSNEHLQDMICWCRKPDGSVRCAAYYEENGGILTVHPAGQARRDIIDEIPISCFLNLYMRNLKCW